jgi:hypothetical protein
MMTDAQVHELVRKKMRLLAQRARDPDHPLHDFLQWDPKTGRPMLPQSDEALAALVLAALDEPDSN